jgi:hypothetical protein
MFKKMTRQQRELYTALRALRECALQASDARPARALHRRGLIRYARRDGVRYIVLKQTAPERREKARLHRWRRGDFWPGREQQHTAPKK